MTEKELRDRVVSLVERAYLGLTDRGEPSEEWPTGTLDDLAGAIESLATLGREYGNEAVLAAAQDVRALGDMREELLVVAVDWIGTGPDETEGQK